MTQLLTLPNAAKRYGDVSDTKADGATFTPTELADFVAAQMLSVAQLPSDRLITVLDPALGHGELLLSLMSLLDRPAKVVGYETDQKSLDTARLRLSAKFPNVTLDLRHGSFLDHVIDDFEPGLFASAERYDLIIANPPYVRTQIMGATRSQLLAKQFGLSGRVDLYHAFLLGMATVLDDHGTAGMIVSNRFMITRGGGATRKALLQNLDLKRIFDLGDTKLFNAAVLPAVIIAKGKAKKSERPEFLTIYETQSASARPVQNPIEALAFEGVSELPDGRRFAVAYGHLDNGQDDSGIWRRGSDALDVWLAKVAQRTWRTFGDVGKIRVGVKTTADKVFLPKKWEIELELLRPLTTHHVARRYRPLALTRKILYPHEVVDGRRRAIPLDGFPLTKEYLERHKVALESRTYVIEAGREWYEIWVPQNPDDWRAPKLVFRDISEKPTFWMDLTGSVVNGDCYWLIADEDVLWLALAVANSTFIEHFYDHRFNNKLYGGRRRFITQYVQEFPLPDPKSEIGLAIIEKAKQVFRLTPSVEGDALQTEIDELVWMSLTGEGAPISS